MLAPMTYFHCRTNGANRLCDDDGGAYRKNHRLLGCDDGFSQWRANGAMAHQEQGDKHPGSQQEIILGTDGARVILGCRVAAKLPRMPEQDNRLSASARGYTRRWGRA